MPLEQIRPSFQVYQSGRTRDARHIKSSIPYDYDGDVEADAETDEGSENLKLSRPKDMNLLKLGGVGGVTRSGTWGQNLFNREKSRETFVSFLTKSPMLMDMASPIESSDKDDSTELASSLIRARSISPDQHRKVAAMDHFRSNSSDIPSSSSRASTSASSYSAAAFSLRSLSHRNSADSTSSSAASLSHSPNQTSHSLAKTDSDYDSTGTRKGASQMSSTYSHMTDGTVVANQSHHDDVQAANESPRSDTSISLHQVGPGVSRIQSIGRGGRNRINNEDGDKEMNLDMCSITDSPSIQQAALDMPSQDSPQLQSSPAPQVASLSLSAAAAAPEFLSRSPSSTFVPAAPRRHTGAYALRSQSALSQSGGAFGTFWGQGGGRAAARELARHSQNFDNAPFSQLEARRAKEHKKYQRRSLATTSGPDFSKEKSNPTKPFTLFTSLSRIDVEDRNVKASTSSAATKDSNEFSQHSPRSPHLDTFVSNASYSGSLVSPITVPIMDSEGSALVRPPLHHLNSATNVLRTPTTEEWSRFLAKQGLDPAAVAASNASRSGSTSKQHTLSQRKMFSDRMATLNLSSTAISDFAVAAAVAAQQQQNDPLRLSGNALSIDDADSDAEDSEGEDTIDTIRTMRLNRSASGILNSTVSLPFDFGEDEDSSNDDKDGSSSDERIQALHEAISRPPSRSGSPTPMTKFGNTQAILKSSEDLREEYKRTRKPTLESTAAVMGYPFAPFGERRKIDDFIILSDIGRGAYGLVKRVQLKCPETGQGVGKEFCIKYIIKSRILADCWRRHKTLGPIPIEIHVMDQLRRLPYKAPLHLPPWSIEELLGLESNLLSLAENIGHPSLCKMIDFFEDYEFYYMVMPCFGKGQDLFDYIEAQPHGLSSLQVRCIFGQVADGLRFLHQNNIVHRDVKDENVILDGNGHAQIIDFGSAAHVNKNGRLFDTFSGTLDYAAAEILKGEKYGGKEQDVWALGVVGYVLLCGDCPFWNGEEAIQGLQLNSRAQRVLQERCSLIPSSPRSSQFDRQEWLEKREFDQLGQIDGGGQIQDAADLIQRCLEVDISMRPSMDLVCQHRFLIGARGWHGPAGWFKDTFATPVAL